MNDFIKNNIKIIIAIIITIVVVTATSVYAAIKIRADEIEYKDGTVQDALNDLYNLSSNSSSDMISSVDFTSLETASSINLNITNEPANSALGYHVIAIDKSDNSKKYWKMCNNKSCSIDSLDASTTYEVYVAAYDINNQFLKSSTKDITTAAGAVKLVPTLTSNTSGGGRAFATYTANGRQAYEAFDGKIPPTASGSTQGYMVASSPTNQIGYDFGEGNSHVVTKVVYYGNADDSNDRFTSFTLQYSDDGSNWTNVETFNTRVITTYTTGKDLAQSFDVSSTQNAHRYWRINGTNSGHGWSGLLELEFFGY